MSWTDIQTAYAGLREVCEAGGSLRQPWRDFVRAAEETESAAPPYHLRTMFSVLDRATAARPGAEISVLEHGCGGGMTLLYLLALGFRGVRGVDVDGMCQKWNRLLRQELGINEQRFFVYDGRTLPLAAASADVIFSEQVLEHVAPTLIDSYYSEEGRVLKPGGLAYHMVPHRFCPYDSHTRTWFVHYLPRRARRWAYRRLGHDAEYVMGMLHLRSPGFHIRQLARHIGPHEDLTASRLARSVDPSYYDASLALRNLIRKLATLPVFGALSRAVLRKLVMLETIAVKR